MKILFCSDSIFKHQVDEDYHEELKAVDELSIPYLFFDFDKLVDDGNAEEAIKNIERDKYESVIYRGWMLTPELYRKLFYSLMTKDLWLINTEHQYINCHWFPSSYNYSAIRKNTPKMVFIPKREFELSEIRSYVKPLLKSYGTKCPIIIKDYVKSEKHFWNEACFCPDANDTSHVEKVVKKFMELRDIEGGVIFKEFVDLENVQFDPILKTQTAKEYRLFFLKGQLIDCSKYWESNEYNELPPLDMFEEIGKGIDSNFFSMDVAKKKDGAWTIIELGDGQCSGLTKSCNIKEFYNKLKCEVEK